MNSIAPLMHGEIATMPTKKPQTPLQSELVKLIRVAMREQGVGYKKLSLMTDFNHQSVCQALGPRRRRGLSVDNLLLILYALGYTCALSIHKRGISKYEQAIIQRRGTTHIERQYAYQKLPNYAEDSAKSVRVDVA
jgi:hypothetical protein